MRAFTLLVTVALLMAAPLAAAHHGYPVGCDYDDDLYNNCHVGNVYWVTGPLCAGAKIGGPAHCTSVRDILAHTLA